MQLIMITWFCLSICLVFLAITSKLNDSNKSKYSMILFVISLGILTYVSSFRYNFIDTYTYRLIYDRSVLEPNFLQIENNGIELGFRYFVYVLNLLNFDSQFFIAITSIFVIIMSGLGIKKYSSDVSISIYLFFILFFMPSMNVIRQSLVAVVLFLSLNDVVKGNWKRYFVLVLLASTFHQSAIVMIPLYYIVRDRAFNKYVILVFIFSVFVYMQPSALEKFITLLSVDNDYLKYAKYTNNGSNIIRSILAFVPVILSYTNYKFSIKSKHDIPKMDNILMNISVINFSVMLMSVKILYISRISLYFDIYNVILYPLFISKLFKGKDRQMIKLIMIVLFSIYHYYSILSYGKYLESFRLIFN